jgi:HEAT repeat protein
MDIQPLIENLSHPDESERLFAADDLGMENAPEAVEPLIAQLAIEPSRAVREMIVLALRRTESDAVMDHAVRLLGSSDPYIRNEMAALLQAKGEAALPWLTKAQQHVDADVRKLALEAACQIPGEHTAALLTTALSDPDANVVISAVEIISTTASASFKEPLEELAREESSPMLLLAVIDALGPSVMNAPCRSFWRGLARKETCRSPSFKQLETWVMTDILSSSRRIPTLHI